MVTNKQAEIEDTVFSYANIARQRHSKHLSVSRNSAQQWRSLWRRCLLLTDKLVEALARTLIVRS